MFPSLRSLQMKRKETKIAIVSKAVIPDLSLIDPVTLLTMPPYLTACTALDALTHGMEAFVSRANSPITDLHALEAIRLISSNLLRHDENPDDVELRTKIMLGSLHAGIAFSNASLGATHAMAHSLGGLLDLAHGECNAALLDHVVEFNFPAAGERYRQIGKAMGLKLGKMALKEGKADILHKVQETARGGSNVIAGLSKRLAFHEPTYLFLPKSNKRPLHGNQPSASRTSAMLR